MKPIQFRRLVAITWMVGFVLLPGCSHSRSARMELVDFRPVTPTTQPTTLPYDDVLSGSRGVWPDISRIRDGAVTTPPALPATAPTTAPSAKFTAELEENVRRLITFARKLTSEGEYQAALRICDAILVLDPKNDYAIGVRPLLEDKILFQEQRERGGPETTQPYFRRLEAEYKPATQPSRPATRSATDFTDEVDRGISLCRKLAKEGEFALALRVTDAILKLDPKNDYALGFRPLLIDGQRPSRFQKQVRWTERATPGTHPATDYRG
jgi:regulator of sirC expression with transglutaminase-like and TPR domain